MPESLECEVLQKARYINTLTFTFTFIETGVQLPTFVSFIFLYTAHTCTDDALNQASF